MKLSDIHLNYKTDKGTAHNYLETYENLFSGIRTNKMNILEIGVLFGGSLKMWEEYFCNSTIYGIEDFSQKDSNKDFGSFDVNAVEVRNDLAKHNRIRLVEGDARDNDFIQKEIGSVGIKFDVIIDDGDHVVPNQVDNFNNLFPYLSDDGVFVIEDVNDMKAAKYLKKYINKNFASVEVEIIPLNIQERADDILMVVRHGRNVTALSRIFGRLFAR